MKNKIKIKFFNLVEIALAIAIAGIGITGILALFPVGFKANQDSVARNYTSDAIENFYTYLRTAAKNDWDNFIVSNTLMPTQIQDQLGGTEGTDTALTNYTEKVPGIYQHNTQAGLYRIYQGSTNIKDFYSAARVWKTKVQTSFYSGNGWTSWNDSGYDYAAGINIELSWPVQKTIDKREKQYYYMQVFKRL